MGGLQVVCLISGGKDSIFSILHCLANSHDVVALANLHPPYDESGGGVDDLDSYMYQTVGHSVIPLFEKALGLPLYRQEITGTSVNRNKSYGPIGSDQGDETEALIPLLTKVKANHPEVNAVSTGAILSDYQRTRVESVAVYLGLTPLSYLWQYPFLGHSSPTALLEDMAAVGQHSRIIKVASGGLDSSFLWQNVADPRTIIRLDKASKRFGSVDDGAVLGEGGEFETLVVAGPPNLWKGRIVVHEEHRRTVIGDAGSASLQIVSASLDMNNDDRNNKQRVRVPELLEPSFEAILDQIRANRTKGATVTREASASACNHDRTPGTSRGGRVNGQLSGTGHTILPSVYGEGLNASEQTRSIMSKVESHLKDQNQTFADVAYTSIILRDMASFPDINAVYGAYFVHPNPPARVTIAYADALPPGKHLAVSFTHVNTSETRLRKGLHVQSRSYWAPANIGPYSQAISVPIDDHEAGLDSDVVYVAGQIPLIPSSMELCTSAVDGNDDAFLLQSVLALQHANRVGRAMRIRRWLCAIAFITAESSACASQRGRIANLAWNALHQHSESIQIDLATEDGSFDIWDVKHGVGSSRSYVAHDFPEVETPVIAPAVEAPMLSVFHVDALPRNASIEWVTYGSSAESGNPDIPHFDHLLRIFQGRVISIT